MDDPRHVANNPAAPGDEQYDAMAELQKSHRALASELIPSDALRPVMDYIRDQQGERSLLKSAEVIPFPRAVDPGERGMKSVFIDPFGVVNQSEYYEKPTGLSFDALKQMVYQTPILNSIVLKRVRQIGRFCQPSSDGGPGFEITHMDPKHKRTPEEEESCQLLTKFIQNCGWEFNPRRRKIMRRENFKAFMTKHYADSLMMDAAPIETEMKRDARLGMDGFYAVDGSTIRLCTEDGYEGDDKIFALQVVQGRIATAYPHEALIYEVRNPRADVRLAGYGLGEPELLVRIVTGFLNAMNYNLNGFDKNSIPKGMLSLIGDYNQDDLSAFKRYWSGMVRGVNNAWGLPVMVAKDKDSAAKFEKFDVDFSDVAFAKWMTLLTSLACAVYGMDPAEINFDSFTSASSSPLSGDNTEARLTSSKDSGLRSDMAHFEAEVTDYMISAFDDKYCFRWVGLDQEDPKTIDDKKKLVMSVDEMRADIGMQPCADSKLGQAPINPSLMQVYMQGMQPPQGQAFGGGDQPQPDYGQPGDDDEEGADGGGPPKQGALPPPDASGGKPPPDQPANSPAGAPNGEFGAGNGQPAPVGDESNAFGKANTLIFHLGDVK